MASPIVSRDAVRAAFDRALALDEQRCRDTAIEATARAMALAPEAVAEVVAQQPEDIT